MAKGKAKVEGEQQDNVQDQLPLVDYNFPAYGITVKAATIEEAEAKLKEIINK